jgi:hypothetical protein
MTARICRPCTLTPLPDRSEFEMRNTLETENNKIRFIIKTENRKERT